MGRFISPEKKQALVAQVDELHAAGIGLTEATKQAGVSLASYWRWKGSRGSKPGPKPRKHPVQVLDLPAPPKPPIAGKLALVIGSPAEIAAIIKEIR